jgi:hypothetical protein
VDQLLPQGQFCDDRIVLNNLKRAANGANFERRPKQCHSVGSFVVKEKNRVGPTKTLSHMSEINYCELKYFLRTMACVDLIGSRDGGDNNR